ncbi:hypothetical protein [Micromonospora sp. NPDC005367]|uniref:hypothetical protein n=1 Tax=Micromonospora sp. NPDC005367 TaxID=3155590 RepID=UPI0033ACE345
MKVNRMPGRYPHTEQARPGLAPGARGPVGTMFAALYGELTPHPWRSTDQDAYSLFYDRSLAMGWLDDVGGVVRHTAEGVEERRTGAAGLWGMNDAGQDHPLAEPESALVAWFQVGVEPLAEGRPLPVQPFLRCVGDTAARLGTLQLHAVQVLLPVQVLGGASRPAAAGIPPSLSTPGWFADGDPRSRTQVRITLDSGQSPSVPAAAPELRESMNRLDQPVFACGSYSLTEHDPLATRPPFDDGLWNGPPLHRVSFHGTLAEWSLDAIGWLGGFLADLGAVHAVATPLLLTASRS